MAISEKDLFEAGFSKREVNNLQSLLSAAGGTMQHLIDALSRRFRVSVWVTIALVLVMLVTLIVGNRSHILSGGMSSLVGVRLENGKYPTLSLFFVQAAVY